MKYIYVDKIEELVTDEQVEKSMCFTDFGDISNRDVIRYSLLKYASSFKTGSTARMVLRDLELISTSDTLTKKGKNYLYLAFYNKQSL